MIKIMNGDNPQAMETECVTIMYNFQQENATNISDM